MRLKVAAEAISDYEWKSRPLTVLFPEFFQFHVSYNIRPDRNYQQLSATKRHRVHAIDIDNSHYLSQLFRTIYVVIQYS